jgi:hypothetical protein
MTETKVIMICRKCHVLMQTDIDNPDIQPLQMHDEELDTINKERFELCCCDDDFVYLDEIK